MTRELAPVVPLRPGQPRQLTPIEIGCPWEPCHAPPGRACTGPFGQPLTQHHFHPSRVDAAKTTAVADSEPRDLAHDRDHHNRRRNP